MRYCQDNDSLLLMILSNNSAKPCSEAGEGLICFSGSLYLLQVESRLRTLCRRGSLGEWSAGQDWSETHSFCKAFLIPVTTANRNIFSTEGEGMEARLGACKPQIHKILNSSVYLVQLLFVRDWCAALKKNQKLQQSLWVVPFHTDFTWILYYTLSLKKQTNEQATTKKSQTDFEEGVKGGTLVRKQGVDFKTSSLQNL